MIFAKILHLTNAIMSEKVASVFLLYQAVDKIGNALFSISTNKQVNERMQGVVLTKSLSDHSRRVSKPKCARVS